MKKSGLYVSDYYDLLALHRALMEAKFNEGPNDFDVSASPILARLHKDLVNEIVRHPDAKDRSNSWEDWLTLSKDRREWNVAISRAADESDWPSWTKDQKQAYSRSLLSPFKVEPGILDEFIQIADFNHSN